MDVLKELFSKVLPLYGFIALGYGAKRWFGLESKGISKILLFFLIPILIVDNVTKAELAEMAVVAGMVFLLASLMSVIGWLSNKFLIKNFNKNLLMSSFSYYNIGWFGIPVVMALFGEQQMPFIVSAYLGNVLFGDTVGYYLVSRSKNMSIKEAVYNVLKIPAIYACVLAIALNLLDIGIPEEFEPVSEAVSWSASALGMLIIGITLCDIDFKNIDYGMFSKILSVRYIAGMVIMGLLVLGERTLLDSLADEQWRLMLLLSSFPIAANLVVFSSFLEVEQENTSLLVGSSSIISLVLVPLICLLLF